MIAETIAGAEMSGTTVELLDVWADPTRSWVQPPETLLDACARTAASGGLHFAMVVETSVADGGLVLAFSAQDAGQVSGAVGAEERLPPQRLALAQIREAATALLGRLPGFATLRVTPAHAQVAVDGMPVGLDAAGIATIVLPPGSHTVEAVARGFDPRSGTLTVTAARTGEIVIALAVAHAAAAVAPPALPEVPPPGIPAVGPVQSPVSGPPAVVPVQGATSTPPAVGPVHASSPTPTPSHHAAPDLAELDRTAAAASREESDPGVSQVWFWVTAVAAAGLVAGGAATAYLMTDRFNELDDARTTCFDEGRLTFVAYDQSGCRRARELDNEGRLFGSVAGALLAAGGVAAGAALVLGFYTDWGGDEDRSSTGLAAAPMLLVGDSGNAQPGLVLTLTY